MDSVTCLKSSSRQNDVNLVNYDHIQSKTDNLLDGMAKKSDNPPPDPLSSPNMAPNNS